MDANEKYVREVWPNALRYSHSGYVFIKLHGCVPVNIIGGDIYPGRFKVEQESDAWAAAAAFTRERKEECRQLREEISEITEWRDYYFKHLGAERGQLESTTLTFNNTRNVAKYSRILSRLESILSDKQAGMKQKEGQ